MFTRDLRDIVTDIALLPSSAGGRKRLLVMLWLACMGIEAWPATAAPIQAAITSKAQLDQYLTSHVRAATPLDNLSPGARKRFLAELDFGPKGLRSVPLDDASHELTHEQVLRLFTLFGVQEFAQGLGISEEARAQMEKERHLDAAARGCTPRTCPESAIEHRYDQLVLAKQDYSLPDADRMALNRKRYDQLLGEYQNERSLAKTSYGDLRLLKRAAEFVLFLVPQPDHIGQLGADLAEMQRREMARPEDFRSYYRSLVVSRQWETASRFLSKYPGVTDDPAPRLTPSELTSTSTPTALSLDPVHGSMTRQSFDLSGPVRIVVVASCHFSQDAARAIESDPPLQELFAKNAIWLASQDESFSTAMAWNRDFPDQEIHIAWTNDEWRSLDTWAMPTFYVFRNGHLVSKFSGWNDLASLKASLKAAGVVE